MMFCLFSLPVYAGTPKDHEKYMEGEEYKAAFEQFTAGIEEAKERLTPDEYKALEKKSDEEIAASVIEDMEAGSSEESAYETAYYYVFEKISRQLRWDWLRKNTEDAQGFYRLKSDVFDGYMTLEKGEDGDYAVDISVMMKNNPEKEGMFYGPGTLSGAKMTASNDDVENAITITFEGETAKVVASQAFNEDSLSEGISLDGEYLREKK
jgi:hypothetical protein